MFIDSRRKLVRSVKNIRENYVPDEIKDRASYNASARE